jgi:ribonuclease HI
VTTTHPIIVFTDGASKRNPGPGGWGVVIVTPDGHVTELGGGAPLTTNNKMELTGAIEALTCLRDVPGKVAVYTDSTYVIQGIESWVHNWKRRGWKTATGGEVLNRELWEDLSALTAARPPRSMSWHYVRGHVGIPGNERVDAIADAYAVKGRTDLYERAGAQQAGWWRWGQQQRTFEGPGLLVPECRGRHADAAYHVGRLRTACERPIRRAVQEGHERCGPGRDPALVGLRPRRRLAPFRRARGRHQPMRPRSIERGRVSTRFLPRRLAS